ncbi:MAG: hypothetical protein V1898_05230 [Patescibacteria group bacterium]
MNLVAENQINRLIKLIQTSPNFFMRLLLIGWLFLFIIVYGCIQAYHLTFNGSCKSFDAVTNRHDDGTYVNSYQAHVRLKKQTRLFSVATLLLTTVCVVAVNLIVSLSVK